VSTERRGGNFIDFIDQRSDNQTVKKLKQSK
jgi:hypothetical protein